MTNYSFISMARRAAAKRMEALTSICSLGLIGAVFIVVSNADFKHIEEREQTVADTACRAAGATAAVRLESVGSAVFVCNKPAAGALARRAS